MAKKNSLPMMSNLDMGPIYRKVILSTEREKRCSFIIFDNQPFKLKHFSLPNGNSLIYMNNCSDLADKIIAEIKQGKSKEMAPEFAVHSLSNEEVGLLYTLTVLISEMLDIPCPQVEFRDNYKEYGSSIAERNYVILCAFPGEYILMMLGTLAHELRHLWQYKYRPEYFEKKVSYKDSLDAYFNSSAELDAEAFAHKLEYAVLGFSGMDSEEYAMGNAKIKRKIKKRMDEIELDEETVYRLKGLLGFLEE